MESSIYILQRRSVFLLSMCHIYVSVIYIPIPAAVSADSSLWASIGWFQRGWCPLAGLNLQDISLLWTNKAAFARSSSIFENHSKWDSSDSLTSIFMFLLCSEYFEPILVPPEMQIQCWSGQTPHSINWVASQRLRFQLCVHCSVHTVRLRQQNVHNIMDLVTNCSHIQLWQIWTMALLLHTGTRLHVARMQT